MAGSLCGLRGPDRHALGGGPRDAALLCVRVFACQPEKATPRHRGLTLKKGANAKAGGRVHQTWRPGVPNWARAGVRRNVWMAAARRGAGQGSGEPPARREPLMRAGEGPQPGGPRDRGARPSPWGRPGTVAPTAPGARSGRLFRRLAALLLLLLLLLLRLLALEAVHQPRQPVLRAGRRERGV